MWISSENHILKMWIFRINWGFLPQYVYKPLQRTFLLSSMKVFSSPYWIPQSWHLRHFKCNLSKFGLIDKKKILSSIVDPQLWHTEGGLDSFPSSAVWSAAWVPLELIGLVVWWWELVCSLLAHIPGFLVDTIWFCCEAYVLAFPTPVKILL